MMEKSATSYDNNLRRVFHFLSITITSLIYGLNNWPMEKVTKALCLITLGVILSDLIRLHINILNNLVQKWFGFILRKHEFHSLSGSSWFLLGAIISLSLFPKPISIFGFLCLAVGDPIASYVGISATKGSKIGQKTWHGSVGFILMTWLVGGLWLLRTYSPLTAFCVATIGSIGGAISEKLLTTFDDNFVIPLVASGFALLTLLMIGYQF